MLIDSHNYLNNWGIKPFIEFFGFRIASYSLFVLLGLIVAFVAFLIYSKKIKQINEKSFIIIAAAIIGGVLGAKIPIWIVNFDKIFNDPLNLELILSGRTIVGGLIGGFLSVLITKRVFKIKKRIGNAIAPSVCLGIAVGRIGCFLRGCCYGKPTNLNWGVDFGDGILRHPTQIYEIVFCLIFFVYLHFKFKKDPKPGQLFQNFLLIYFIFRFLVEFIRVEKVIFLGLTAFQYVALMIIIFIIIKKTKFFKKNDESKQSN